MKINEGSEYQCALCAREHERCYCPPGVTCGRFLKKPEIEINKREGISILAKSETKPDNLMRCMEEFAELIQATSKMWRNENPQNRENLIEEIADAIISIELLEEIYWIDKDRIHEEINKKMKRNLNRIESEK